MDEVPTLYIMEAPGAWRCALYMCGLGLLPKSLRRICVSPAIPEKTNHSTCKHYTLNKGTRVGGRMGSLQVVVEFVG